MKCTRCRPQQDRYCWDYLTLSITADDARASGDADWIREAQEELAAHLGLSLAETEAHEAEVYAV